MADINFFTDSSSDMSFEFYEKYDIGVVPFYVTFDKKTYLKEKIDITISDFYQRMTKEKVFPSTSMPSVSDYIDAFRPKLAGGGDIVCICLTEKFSTSYNSAVSAAEELAAEFPGQKIRIIDSKQASGGQGYALYQMQKMKEAGYETDQICGRMDGILKNSRVFLTVDTLEYLQRGGRLGLLSALTGSLLQIKPIITMRFGELHPDGKVRGRQRAIERIIQMTDDYLGDKRSQYDIGILHSVCIDEAKKLELTMTSSGYEFAQPIIELGTTIGAHIGPSVIGIVTVPRFDSEIS